MDESGDSKDLQSLFDNIAAGAPPDPPEPPPKVVPPKAAGGDAGDSPELEDLFDSVAAETQVTAAPKPASASVPAKPASGGDSGDSPELENLFDAVAAETQPPPPTKPSVPAPKPVASTSGASATGDSPELEALFDSVVSDAPSSSEADQPQDEGDAQEVVFNRLGHLARKLYDDMREIGVDKAVAEGARQVPDVRERLAYVSDLTLKAAERVFAATDIAKPLQEQLLDQSTALNQRWEKMFANQLSVDEFKLLAADTKSYFNDAPGKIKGTQAQLTEITMAQDFQDLSGQVLKKVAEIIQNLETQLLAVLIEAIPPQIKEEKAEELEHTGLMNGPVINADGRSDVVTSQEQVDDLLESLGF